MLNTMKSFFFFFQTDNDAIIDNDEYSAQHLKDDVIMTSF